MAAICGPAAVVQKLCRQPSVRDCCGVVCDVGTFPASGHGAVSWRHPCRADRGAGVADVPEQLAWVFSDSFCRRRGLRFSVDL